MSSPPRYALGTTDAVSWLRALPAESVDLVITDPAYESLEKHRAIGTTTRLKHSKASSNDWFHVFPNTRFEELLVELYRVLKRHTHCYMFCDQETMFVIKPIAEAVGFRFWKPIIWDKCKIGMGYHYRAQYECIMFFEKGKRRLNNLAVPDVLSVPRIRSGYPTEKPVELATILVEQSSVLGESIADPFMGSGAFGVGAVSSGRNFLGTDIRAQAVKLAERRLVERGAQAERLKKEPRKIAAAG